MADLDGVKAGDRLVLVRPNSIEFVEVQRTTKTMIVLVGDARTWNRRGSVRGEVGGWRRSYLRLPQDGDKETIAKQGATEALRLALFDVGRLLRKDLEAATEDIVAAVDALRKLGASTDA